MPARFRAYLLMTFVVAVWGTTFVIVKAALADSTPGAYNLMRMLFAILILAIAYRGSLHGLSRRQILGGALVGLFLALGYQFQTIGLSKTTPSKSAFITGLVVVLVPLLSALPGLRPRNARPPRWNAWLGAIAAFLGILFLTTQAGQGLLPDFRSINLGDILTLGCAFGFALHCIAISHNTQTGFKALAQLQVGFSAVFLAASLLLVEKPHVHFTPRLFLALAISAVLATALAFSVQSWAQTILPPTHTALIMTLEPVFAWITSYLFIGEHLGPRQFSGALLILAGIALTEFIPQTHLPTAHEA